MGQGFEHLVQGRRRLAPEGRAEPGADIQGANLAKRAVIQWAVPVAGPVKLPVVEHHQSAVAGQPDIQLNPIGPGGQGPMKGGYGVFRRLFDITPVGNYQRHRERPRVDVPGGHSVIWFAMGHGGLYL